jgi:hypothetical protein
VFSRGDTPYEGSATIALTVINFGLLALLLTQTRISVGPGGIRVWTNMQGSVLRGRSLEIIDDEGRVRAGIMVHPADPAATTLSGGTTILRLVDENGRPSVKLATTQQGGGLALVGESQGTYVQLSANELTATKDGRQQLIP